MWSWLIQWLSDSSPRITQGWQIGFSAECVRKYVRPLKSLTLMKRSQMGFAKVLYCRRRIEFVLEISLFNWSFSSISICNFVILLLFARGYLFYRTFCFQAIAIKLIVPRGCNTKENNIFVCAITQCITFLGRDIVCFYYSL